MTCPSRSSVRVPALAVRCGQPSYERRKLAVSLRPQHEVEVVRHQAVRQTPHRNTSLSFGEDVDQREVLAGAIEQGEPANPSIKDVKYDARHSDSFSIRHGAAVLKIPARIQADGHAEMETGGSTEARKDSRGPHSAIDSAFRVDDLRRRERRAL